ncbi:MAG: hypothetical protein KBG42_11155 [Lachnospiraceae bacterium]|nr:hypothetical protein [Lachnospiraceae bacterium]
MSEIDDLINMIDGKMNSGVSRLKVGFSDEVEEGQKKEAYHLGRCDVGSPWATGTVGNCDAVDTDLQVK